MQFVTFGNRIATENFNIGFFYKITFTDSTDVECTCIGIGANFVSFQRQEPELLFTLTLENASTVLSIDFLGGGGTDDYEDLNNKPQINNVELVGNKSLSDLGIQPIIDSSHKLDADLVDDTSSTHKFATAEQLSQIETNKNNILSIHKSADLYFSESEPTGTITTGSYWISTTGNKTYGGNVTFTSFPQTIELDSITACTISGNMVQSGAPTTANPTYPTECGDMVESGEHTGHYAIPIECGATTTTIYLGETQSTRRIKKYVFTGEESFVQSVAAGMLQCDISDSLANTTVVFCSHFKHVSDVPSPEERQGTCFHASGINDTNIQFGAANTYTPATFKQFLASQYGENTPVTIWYVLATPITAALNEPIRKIDEYVDTISGGSITTSGTSETLDVDTTLKPTSVTLTVTGWH